MLRHSSIFCIFVFTCLGRCEGTVTKYDEGKGTHTVTFDDGDVKEYDLVGKRFKLLPVPARGTSDAPGAGSST